MTTEKKKTIFDHIAHIREVKSPKYLSTLSEAERNDFSKSKYVILLGLGMDDRILESVSELYKRMEYLDDESFYKLCCKLVPKGRRFVKWIKAANSKKISPDIITLISKNFLISKREAYGYYEQYLQSEDGIQELCNLCTDNGLSDTETERMILNE